MIKSILIVGGGSAGWITAHVLNATLNAGSDQTAAISLVESPDITPIGVGEATVPSIRRTLQTIGLSEAEFMRATDATFKSLIRFIDWNSGEEFDHPFDRRKRPDTDASIEAWLKSEGQDEDFAKAFSILSNLADRNLAPKAIGWPDYASTFPYAYHLDANKLAGLLSDMASARGVRHILANIIDVTLDEAGQIEHVDTDTSQRLTADLYIDCTGFRAALISRALGIRTISYADKLLCDRAVTVQVPYEVYRPENIRPFTTATARNAGWSWDINLQGRRGLGYVYSSNFLDANEAERDLKTAEGGHAADLPVNHIRFNSCKRAQSWASNCVAVGLADGFLEPLESSGLYMIEFAAQALAELIPHAGPVQSNVATHFNTRMQALYEEVLDYINLHYVTSQRRDTPFWRAATAPEAITDSLAAKLELWRTKRPTDLDFLTQSRLFSVESYEYLLFGMKYTHAQSVQARTEIHDISDMLDKCYRKFPRHEDWLATLGR